MDSIDIFTQVKEQLKKMDVTLVAVSKTQSDQAILERVATGQHIFGENRVQELVRKYQNLPKEILWHQIGHLQTNKVKSIIPFVAMIHSGDSLKLLRKISLEATAVGRTIDVLLQAKVATEVTKFGFDPTQLSDEHILAEIAAMPSIRICGLMGMASFTIDKNLVRQEFRTLRQIFERLKSSNLFGNDFQFLSMGMSGDYELAIEEGSNMVRIGSLIF